MSEDVEQWSDDKVYEAFGYPRTAKVVWSDRSPVGPSAPSQVVAPIKLTHPVLSSLLKDDIMLADFGSSFVSTSRLHQQTPATPIHYMCPEGLFESQYSMASDIRSLACTIFEIRTGSPMFDPFFPMKNLIVKQIVETLGRLPEPWWTSWDARHHWFDEAGGAKAPENDEAGKFRLPVSLTSLKEKLRAIGLDGRQAKVHAGPLFGLPGTTMPEEEAILFEDLLEKMLRYHPETRITASEVADHPWFAYT